MIALALIAILFTGVGSAFELCASHAQKIGTDVSVGAGGTTAVQFHVGTRCHAQQYAISADSVRCQLVAYNPIYSQTLFSVSREYSQVTSSPHKFNFVLNAIRMVRFPLDCHYADTDECHSHVNISCHNVSNPSQRFNSDISVDFTVSPHSKPQPGESCYFSAYTRLVQNGLQHSKEGCVEHRIKGQQSWSTVCTKGFGTNEAKVACREMCGEGKYAMETEGEKYCSPPFPPTRVTELDCNGDEKSLHQCSYKTVPPADDCDSGITGVNCGSLEVVSKPIINLNCTSEAYHLVLRSKASYATISNVSIPGTDCRWTVAGTAFDLKLVFNNNNCPATREEQSERFIYKQAINVLMRVEEDGQVMYTQSHFTLGCSRDRLAAANASLIPSQNVDDNMTGTVPFNIKIDLFKDRGFSKSFKPGDRPPIDTRVYAQVSATASGEVDKLLKLQAFRCWLQDTSVAMPNPKTFVIIHQSCPTKQNSLGVEIFTLANPHRVRFSFIPATFQPKDPRMALVCQAKLCDLVSGTDASCKYTTSQNCKAQHSRQSLNDLLQGKWPDRHSNKGWEWESEHELKHGGGSSSSRPHSSWYWRQVQVNFERQQMDLPQTATSPQLDWLIKNEDDLKEETENGISIHMYKGEPNIGEDPEPSVEPGF